MRSNKSGSKLVEMWRRGWKSALGGNVEGGGQELIMKWSKALMRVL